MIDSQLKKSIDILLNDDDVKQVLEEIQIDNDRTLQEQIHITEIPAPPFKERERGDYLLQRFRELDLHYVRKDEVGNVIGIRKGLVNNSNIIISAHMDTVFGENVSIQVKKDGEIYKAPGIFDDTRGLAELITIIKNLNNSNIQTNSNIIFVATVGEEGLGDLRGVKNLFKEIENIKAFISIDGMKKEQVIYGATSSKRIEVEFITKGGHSYREYGLPSSIHAMGRAISKIADLNPSNNYKSTFTVGTVNGGTSVNSIASNAKMLLDIRSTSSEELKNMQDKILEMIDISIEEERQRWNNTEIFSQVNIVGDRPGGEQSRNALIVSIANHVNRHLGIETDYINEGSTDSNIAIHKGIPAITIGRGGEGGQTHTLGEWYKNTDGYLSPQRTLLILLIISGVKGRLDVANLKDNFI